MRSKFSYVMNQTLFYFLKYTRPFRPLKSTTNSVLLVFFAHIGDFILWLNSAKAYRNLYPNQKVILLCRRFKDISSIAEKTGFFDEIILVDDGWKKRLVSVVRMMRCKYDTVINARATRDLQSDIFVLAPRSKHRIAPQSDHTLLSPKWLKRSDAAYTKIIPCDGIQTMELLRNAQFIRGQGCSSFRASLPQLPSFKRPEGLPEKFFAVCPGANNTANCWPAESFSKVIDTLTETLKLPCILLGITQEKAIGELIQCKSRNPRQIISYMGTTTQEEYIEIIRSACFLLTNDTSAGHIAPAVRTHAVVVQPGWNYGRFFPYQTEHTEDCMWFPQSISASLPCLGCGTDPTRNGNPACLIEGVMRCILAVKVQDVLNAIYFITKSSKEDLNVVLAEGQEEVSGNV